MVDVDCAVGKAPCLNASDDSGYEIDEAEVAYWGRCPDCLDKSKSRVSKVRLTTSAKATVVKKSDTAIKGSRVKSTVRSHQRSPKKIARTK